MAMKIKEAKWNRKIKKKINLQKAENIIIEMMSFMEYFIIRKKGISFGIIFTKKKIRC